MAEVRQRKITKEPTADPATTTSDENEELIDNNDNNNNDPDFSWSAWSTWPSSLKLSPIPLALLALFATLYYQHLTSPDPGLDLRTPESCVATFNFTFRINAARSQAESLATHSWEYGTAAEAITELVNPGKSVFAVEPFPGGKVPEQELRLDQALIWVYQRIRTDNVTLFDDDGWSVSDPASLGVAAVMLGQRWKWEKYVRAAERQKDFLLNDAPRYVNGAISHRRDVAELWNDAVSMFPPFLAYYAVHKQDLALMRAAVHQIQLYRDALVIPDGPKRGLWKHIVGPSELADDGAWSTGNAWAAYGMARVRATVAGWKPSREVMSDEIGKLDRWIGEILDGAIRTDDNDESGLLRNYLGQESWFAETSGTALLAATAYRMAVIKPEIYAQAPYLDWAHAKRAAVVSRIDDDGFAKPAVNPLKHSSREPVEASPEGESFLVMMGSAWRDCVCRGVCAPEDQGRVGWR
ncbi:hypothetical protein LTR91_015619 [Friedmanniomyces endolithicus]|uniref:Uncharacterized protein n=1 Tax=Friedmanniomyces endolithicus TaxID=329885 RepID=A0AAN6K9S0_9PEZI|nr:hypothetical protein LTR94_008470 [Friedmanniomyces endolithicus]KAK0795585.1 hypothetical protein LTR59_007404 [Friedmanniomyces endolithicus]KAK0797660.1 hypothetical protein LTR38_008124 [Friedmanniomyces endolithicus]KAK0816349.1 hypothetical protein LTR75_003575 [Friedmanniomyces endolithicus]KAK0862374.1 hypothetical protein LTS02_007250 [Friedmanniomyces endolithicus]